MSLVASHGLSKVSLMSMAVLLLVLFQGTSTSLSLAYQLAPSLEGAVNLLWGMIYLMSFVGLVSNFGINWITWLVRYRLLLVLLLIGTAFSAFWSVDAALTMERTVHLIGSTLIAFYIGLTIPLTRILSLSAVVLTLLMIASAVAALFFTDVGIENYEGQLVWRGVMASKNTLGFWAAISVLLCAVVMGNVQAFERKALCFLGMLCAGLVLTFTVSATSLLALLVSAMLMSYFYLARRFNLGLISMLILGALLASLAGMMILNVNTAELIGRSGDLTGRGEVWSQTWKLVQQKPLTGYGYGTIWYPTDTSVWIQEALTDFTWTVYHAHNGLLQMASEIGLPLTALAVLMIVQQLVEIFYCQYQRQQAGVLFVLGFSVALIVSNYSEARLMVNRELYWIFFVALPISMLQQVTINATAMGGVFNPIPSPLHKRTREKQASNASDREHRQALKTRLRKRLDTDKEASGHIFEGNVSTQKTGEIYRLDTHRKSTNKLARRQKKTG